MADEGGQAADRNGKSDPYVKLSIIGQKHKSKTVMRNLNPEWDERFEFRGTLSELLAAPLTLECFDYDYLTKDDL